MITTTEYRQLKAFARQDGLILGLIWVLSMACFVGSIKHPMLQFGFIAGTLSTPFVLYGLLRHYRDDILTGTISFRRAYMYTVRTTINAALIIAAATYVYFQFLDHGALMGALMENIKMPEVQESFRQAGMTPEQVTEQLNVITESRPIDFAFSILFDGILFAFVISLFVSLFGKKSLPAKTV